MEKAERGKNAQLAYSFDIALQNEFSLEENIALARQFLLENFVSRGIQRRMVEAGITNAGAYMRKMALNGYILHVDLAPVKELVSLQLRCANNLNQVAVHANTFGVYPEEIAGLQRDYEKFWGRVSDVLTELSALVEK